MALVQWCCDAFYLYESSATSIEQEDNARDRDSREASDEAGAGNASDKHSAEGSHPSLLKLVGGTQTASQASMVTARPVLQRVVSQPATVPMTIKSGPLTLAAPTATASQVIKEIAKPGLQTPWNS